MRLKYLAAASAAAALLALTTSRPARAAENDPNARVLRVERWLKAILRHQPGAKDAAISELGAWSNANLRTLLIDEDAFAQLIANPTRLTFRLRNAARNSRLPYTEWQFHRLRILACFAGGDLTTPACTSLGAFAEGDPTLVELAGLVATSRKNGDDHTVLRRGALLHGDVAMSEPESIDSPDTSAIGSTTLRVQVADGQETGLGLGAVHWELARLLFDLTAPTAQDELVRNWYAATSAWMQSRERHDSVHMRRARDLFPDDPDILFLSGFQQETYASPAIQSVARSAVLPPGYWIDVPAETMALRNAEAYFKHALAKDPRMTEARVRLGHVLLVRGRAGEAAELLREVAPLPHQRLLRYYAALLLGAAEESLGRFDQARDAYERASVEAPGAQSPHLALSLLARRRGDRAGALKETGRLFELPNILRQPDDPWWAYRLVQEDKVAALFERLYAPFASETK